MLKVAACTAEGCRGRNERTSLQNEKKDNKEIAIKKEIATDCFCGPVASHYKIFFLFLLCCDTYLITCSRNPKFKFFFSVTKNHLISSLEGGRTMNGKKLLIETTK